MADRPIDQVLAERGFRRADARAAARAALERAGLTNPRKERLSLEKLARAEEVLARDLARACADEFCRERSAARRPEASRVDVDPADCEVCAGSPNRRAAERLAQACAGRRPRLVVVGGSPDVRRELERLAGASVELRLVDGTGGMTADRARHDIDWADLVIVGGASELAHKVSVPYTDAPNGRGKVITVHQRGVAAFLDAAALRLGGGRPARRGGRR